MKTLDEAVALRQQWQRNRSEDGIGGFAVAATAAPDTFIGFCGVRKALEKNEAELNVYYRFSPESQGKGFAQEATFAASIRLAEKLGFTHDAGAEVPGDYDIYRL